MEELLRLLLSPDVSNRMLAFQTMIGNPEKFWFGWTENIQLHNPEAVRLIETNQDTSFVEGHVLHSYDRWKQKFTNPEYIGVSHEFPNPFKTEGETIGITYFNPSKRNDLNIIGLDIIIKK